MALTVTDKQLEVINNERQPVVVVQHRRTKKGYIVRPESVYHQVRPLIEFMSDKGATAGYGETSWTDAKNARRMALINQKLDSKLTADEKRELASLQVEVRRFPKRIASQRNHAWELIVQVLEQRAKKPPAERHTFDARDCGGSSPLTAVAVATVTSEASFLTARGGLHSC